MLESHPLPFTCTGIDLAGPYFIKESKLRQKTLIKAYVCLFVCLSTKAVHLDIVTDLTTNAFLNTFKRFISRRGLPKNVYSDNAKNFVGANNALKCFYQALSENTPDNPHQQFLHENRISWYFIPARSPHHGGLWVSAIKSFKSHFKRVIGDTILTLEQMLTVITHIECILNSRPLVPLSSSDPSDLQVLTPGHF